MKVNKNKKSNKKSKKHIFKHKKNITRNKSLINKKNTSEKIPSIFNATIYCFILIKSIIILTLIIIFSFLYQTKEKEFYQLSSNQKMKDYLTKKFVIFANRGCPHCGLFSFFIVQIGCVNKYLLDGYMPIIDIQNFDNVYNKGNKNISNPWELFFYQVNNYTLEEVKKYANDSKYVECGGDWYRPDENNIYYQNDSIKYWHGIHKKYMPIRNEIMKEAEINMKRFFGKSKNILGVLIRGTDYVKGRPPRHPIPPKVERVIIDVKEMDKNYNYDFIYFTSEDEQIRNKFISEFKDKVKYLIPKFSSHYINHNITDINVKIKEYHDFVRIYLINIIIISKCLDIVISRCSGAAGVFVLTEGFRHTKVYNLGLYK